MRVARKEPTAQKYNIYYPNIFSSPPGNMSRYIKIQRKNIPENKTQGISEKNPRLKNKKINKQFGTIVR